MDVDMSCSSQNSITPTAQDKPDQIDGNTMTFEISGSAHQINPIQANQNRGDGFTINNRYGAPGGSPTRDTGQKEGSSSKNSSTSKDEKKRKKNDGGTTTFEISGCANEINPTHANQNLRENFTTNNSYKAPVGNPTSDIPIGTREREGRSSKKSSTPKDDKKRRKTDGCTTTFEISSCADQINPTQANQNFGENFTIDNSCKAPVGNPTSDFPIGTSEKEGRSSKKSSTSKDDKKRGKTDGCITTFVISSYANQINPTQANQNSGGNFTVNNSYEDAVGSRTGKKEGCSSKKSSTSKDEKNRKKTDDETSLNFGEKLKLQPMSSSSRSGSIMTSEITGSAHQIDPSQANRNSRKTSKKQGRG